MEQPGDYCITYNGALVQKAGDAVRLRKRRSAAMTTVTRKLSREVGSHLHALDRKYAFIPLNRR